MNKLHRTAKRLQRKTPASEIWFRELMARYVVIHHSDKFNQPYGHYIPDILNNKYKYVIEVDGNAHDSIDQTKRDDRKDQYFRDRGFMVFRVQIYNMIEACDALNGIKNLRDGRPVEKLPYKFLAK